MNKQTTRIISRVYEYLRDTLIPTNNQGNIDYCDVCKAIGNGLTPFEVVGILHILLKKGKIHGSVSTYAAYIVLK